RLGGDGSQTRIVIDLDHAVTGKVIADGSIDRRVIVVLQGVSAPTTQGAAQGAGAGLVKTWVVDQTGAGARLRIDLATDATIKRRFLLPPADGVDHYRYVIDVAAAPGAPPVKVAKPREV